MKEFIRLFFGDIPSKADILDALKVSALVLLAIALVNIIEKL